ncbi:MAG: penicillin-binding protein 2 [Pseudomonadota bacterium]
MIRKPLRPLAEVLRARARGENPREIEKDNIRARHEAMKDGARLRAEGRLLILCIFFLGAFGAVGGRMAVLASSDPTEPKAARFGEQILSSRADIVDRKGRLLATNFETFSLYAQPQRMVAPKVAAERLAQIFPDLEITKLTGLFTGDRKFVWVKRNLSPEQKQAVHDIGEPGLQFGPREMRLYPNGAIAAHVLGGARYGREGVSSAEVIGVAGVERAFEDRLRSIDRGNEPLRLSIDLSVQAATEEILAGGMRLMQAKGASAVLMRVQTGEIVALASLPDFDPNQRPRPLTTGDQGDSPLFNRALQGVYELGSVFKIFTMAQGIDLGLVNAHTEIDTTGPLKSGGHKIRDYRDYGPSLSVRDVLVKSSNIGTARVAMEIGAHRQKAFLDQLGLLEATPVEMVEAKGAAPLLPKPWSETSMLTISYGHGMSASPVHLASAYAAMVNGGTAVTPTLLKQDAPQEGPRVISQQTSAVVRDMLRGVVVEGTASMADVPGYYVGGKTGTADKPKPQGGGYFEDKVIATFASVFPAHKPEYVLIVTLDEPRETTGEEERRTAGWTAVPVAAETIRRVAPLLGLRPGVERSLKSGVTLASD